MSPNDKQIGGDHYRNKGDYQHWDWCRDYEHEIGYLEGCASKYVSRWHEKNGQQDLEKALHYVDKRLESLPWHWFLWRRRRRKLQRMNLPFASGGEEQAALLIAFWAGPDDLLVAKQLIRGLVAISFEAPPRYGSFKLNKRYPAKLVDQGRRLYEIVDEEGEKISIGAYGRTRKGGETWTFEKFD